MLLYTCLGKRLTGRKGGRFAVITESIAVASAEMIDEAVLVVVDADSLCLLCAT